MLTTTYEMLQNAYKGHYAVPAINTQGGTYDIIRAVCMAAEELRSPVILAHYVNTGAYSGHEWPPRYLCRLQSIWTMETALSAVWRC